MATRTKKTPIRALGALLGVLTALGVMLSLGCVGAGSAPAQGQGQYAVATSAPTGHGPATLLIANNSNEAIYYIHMSPSSQSTWGPDLLGEQVLQRGQSFTLSNIGPGQWDLRIVDRSQNYMEWRGAYLEAGGNYNVNVPSTGWRR